VNILTDKLTQARHLLHRTEQKWQTNENLSAPPLALGLEAIDNHLSKGRTDIYSIHEFYMQVGHGGASLCSAILSQLNAQNKNRNIFWISPSHSNDNGQLYSTSLPKAVRERLIFISPKRELDILWCFEECLSSRQAASVIAEVSHLDLTTSRRLQLACEKGHSLGIALCQNSLGLQNSSAARTRWRICGAEKQNWMMELLGGRGVLPERWIVECDATTFSLSLVSATGNGSLHSNATRH